MLDFHVGIFVEIYSHNYEQYLLCINTLEIAIIHYKLFESMLFLNIFLKYANKIKFRY